MLQFRFKITDNIASIIVDSFALFLHDGGNMQRKKKLMDTLPFLTALTFFSPPRLINYIKITAVSSFALFKFCFCLEDLTFFSVHNSSIIDNRCKTFVRAKLKNIKSMGTSNSITVSICMKNTVFKTMHFH